MQVSVRGGRAALELVEGIGDEIRETLEREALPITDPLRTAAATYPPEREGQTYVRTYTLQAGWQDAPVQVQFVAGGLTMALENPVPYVSDVQEEPQDPYFVNRWPTLEQIAGEQEPVVAAEIDDALRGLGRGR